MRIVKGLVLIVVLFVAFVAAALVLMPKERIAKVASAELSKALGRDVQITGDLGISVWPVLGVKTGPVLIAGPEWSDAPLLKAEALNIGVGAAAALRREIEIKRVELVAPEINLITAADGRTSWSFGDESASEGDGSIRAFSLERAEVRGGRVLIEDRSTGTRERITGLNAVVTLPDLAGQATLSAQGQRGAGALSVEATAASGRDFIAGKLTPVSLRFETAGGTARFDGSATKALEADGQLKLALGNTSQFMSSLGLGGADVPRGLGQSVNLDARMIFSGGKVLNLRGMTLGLDQNSLRGDADIRLDGPRPKVTAKLSAGALDFTALASEGGSSGDGSAGWSRTKIDAGGLSAMDAAVNLRADAIDAGMIALGASTVTVKLDNSRAVFGLREAAGYGGKITGEFVINNRSGLSVGGNLSALQVDVQPLLVDLMDVDRLSGKADGFVKFLGVGSSLDAIMNSLSGDGGIAMGGGTINGFDLNKLLGTGNGASGTTIFDQLAASWTMKDGVLRNDNLTMSLPGFTATGKGRVGLGAQDIDYTFTPVALKANKGKDLAFPVRIRGPWADPKIQPDLSAAIDLNFKEKKEEVKKKAETAIKKKVEKELGVSVGEGESVEDAIKKGVEDKLKKELLKIFD